jgi:GNAT superfamily N-acetyltransferase
MRWASRLDCRRIIPVPHFAAANDNPPTQRFGFDATIVRAAGFNEQAAIIDLMLRANREYRATLPARIYEAYMRDLRALAARRADRDFLVAESDGRILGAVAYHRDASRTGWSLPPEWASLRALAVDPAARGRGIGRQLAEACVLRAWRIGRSALVLHNAAFQIAARRLYCALGFERCPDYDLGVGDLPGLDLKDERLAIDAFRLDLARRNAWQRYYP